MVGKAKLESGRAIPELELLPQLKNLHRKLTETCRFFFRGSMKCKENEKVPFKGFILYGPPGSGKTEVVRQIARTLDISEGKVFLFLVDGATIAAPKWGEAEKTIGAIFRRAIGDLQSDKNSKIILLFDDIESLMISRGSNLTKEWHYSINSVLFHEIDALDPTKIIIFATTNRPDLVDEALKSRLYSIEVPSLQTSQLLHVVDQILATTHTKPEDQQKVRKTVKKKLDSLKKPTIRDAQQMTILECIEGGIWRA